MFDLIKKMLPYIDKNDIKADKGLMILSGIYKIPTSISDISKQYKLR